MARKPRNVVSWWAPPPEVICPLCLRPIPPSQEDEHHLVPRVKGGKETKTLHRVCHRQLHALFSESELASQYNSPEALLTHPEVQKFVAWVKTKPPEFYLSSKMSHRRR